MPMANETQPPVPQSVIDYLTSKGLQSSEHWTEVWREEHATAFTVARSAGYDILSDIQDALVKNIREGGTYRSFEKDLKPNLQAKGWWGWAIDKETGEVLKQYEGTGEPVELGTPRRLKIIYEANWATANAAGQWERIQQRVTTSPYLLYQLGPSKEHRPEHQRWDGMILRADDPWWDSHYPPNGWGCKCYVDQITRREADRLIASGKYADYRTSSPPADELVPWKNKTTGEVSYVPKGIDPGWDTNPGKVRHGSALRVMTEKAAKMGDAVDIKADSTAAKLLRWVIKMLSLQN